MPCQDDPSEKGKALGDVAGTVATVFDFVTASPAGTVVRSLIGPVQRE